MMVEWLPKPIHYSTLETDRLQLAEAYQYANENSPDPSTKNGAILESADGKVLTYGVNEFPRGIDSTKDRLLDKTTKYRMIVHAEQCAILNAARQGKSTYGTTLYCPFYTCSECAKNIIHSGVSRVVGHVSLMNLAGDHKTWVESIIHGWEMLHEAGVRCELYNGHIGVTTRFNGKDVLV